MTVNIDEITTLREFNDFVHTCSDTVLNVLAGEVKYMDDNKHLQENGICLRVLENIQKNGTATFMDICIPIAFEFLKRYCKSF